MNILFVGSGSIATRHIKIINDKYPSYKIYLLSSGIGRYNKIKIEKENIFYSWFEVDKSNISFDIAFICNPTYLHIKQAIECAKRKMNLFIEKPLSHSTNQIFELLNIATKNNLTIYVAYPFRFHKKINEFKYDNSMHNYLSKNTGRISCFTNVDLWGKDSYSFDYKKGGGVLFELSHEIDLAQYIFGDISKINGRLIKHKIHDIFSCAYLNIKLTSGFSIGLTLRLDSKVSYTKRFMIFERSNTIKKYLQYSSNNEMYEKQIEYFFKNYKNKFLMNNIYNASSLFVKINKLEEKWRK